ncbi:hypothetical protein PPL_01084 [Heterostelium album PN500]|uniref:DOT1 domain-containing protein n=1 Tax=Heterostelium pallidum (strain ATCC 26659 / Pp 5 / PN500) TaxID=670386 RepID=D3AY25_HETP5|nr:hypothetical protein PPL_01084 [Heterostelium album PN500]EFA85852.1 hypothetical protein PPL_01084 [Heterostelium album PN500]|eukprot:XP_020437958.1 hypothetical protein PPL_01084 [Heterostelium album PN500]
MNFQNIKRKKQKREAEESSEDSYDLEELKQQFMAIVAKITKENDRIDFISFVSEHLDLNIEDTEHDPTQDESQDDVKLATIIQDLKDHMPSIDCIAPNEKTIIPKNDNFKGYTKENTINVDSFLYTDDEIDDLVEAGKLKNNYCLDCKSYNVKPLNFISHSTSPQLLKFVFSDGVLSGDQSKKVFLDIGSRLGSVLYTGYLFSNIKQLVGIELDKFFYDLQCDMVKKYDMNDRIKLVHGDILKNEALIKNADIIFMNNVFEFFESDLKVHIGFWNKLKELTLGRKSVRIISIPSIQDIFKYNKLGLSLKGWLKEVHLHPEHLKHLDDDGIDEFKDLHLYQICKK